MATYRQGLEPSLQLHLAAFDDTMGLECFIQLSIRVTNRLYGGKSMPKSTCSTSPTRVSQPSGTPTRAHASRQHTSVLGRTSMPADPRIMSILRPGGTCHTDMSHPSPTTSGECGFLVPSQCTSSNHCCAAHYLSRFCFSLCPP